MRTIAIAKLGNNASIASMSSSSNCFERTPPLSIDLPESWKLLREEVEKDYFTELTNFLDGERQSHTILPPPEDVFAAFAATPLEDVKVLIVGQDPYHNLGQAHGLCFSVLPGVKLPPSLKNIYKELETDLDVPPADHGYLMSWASKAFCCSTRC